MMTSAPLTRLLYVEDDEIIVEIVMMTLEDIGGFEVKRCASGQEALKTVVAFAPQLILMDVIMPVMDGPKTLEHLRAMPETKAIPVIFLTAKAQIHEQEAYLRVGAAGVIVKPFDTLVLCEQIRAIWESGAAADRTTTPQGF